MCDNEIIADAYDQGYAKGYQEGYETGLEHGYEAGRVDLESEMRQIARVLDISAPFTKSDLDAFWYNK